MVANRDSHDITEQPGGVPKRQKVDSTSKSSTERDLEMLVFGGDEDDVANDIFARMDNGKLSRLETAETESSDEESDVGMENGSGDEQSGSEDEASEAEVDGDSLFFVDTAHGEADENTAEDTDDSTSTSDSDSESEDENVEKAAWVDEDMQNATVALKDQKRTRKLRTAEEENAVSGDVYEQRLRQQFQKINPVPKWAAEASSSAWADDDSDTEGTRVGGDMLKSTASMISKTSSLLPPSKIEITQLRDGNQAAVSQSKVSSVEFHPTSSVLLTAGLDKTLRLFEVDGKDNQKIQSIFFKDLPITTANFIRGGNEVVVSGRRSWYYSVDVEKGSVSRIGGIPGHKMNSLQYMTCSPNSDRMAFMDNGGQIHLVTTTTKQFTNTLAMNGAVRDVVFSSDGNYLWSTGLDNEVYKWDLRQNRCLSRWHDTATFKPTCLGVSPDSSYYASGDSAGVVNIYDTKSAKSKRAGMAGEFYSVKAFKSIGNLTTSIEGLKFNHSSEILGIYSRKKPEQLKLVHLPTGSVFANWPTFTSRLGHIESIDFSPNSGYMVVGNDSGKALLYRLSHYKNY
ncbi:U3 snoRNP protein [Coemansia erecta]|uniref:U3 snoRNP protein n=1 Tax=Coemansia erecta TaxID=147472 RepID=A0A9W8CR95_9FUNG|nr:U3 snoRNP protein [Coemansia erecta]